MPPLWGKRMSTESITFPRSTGTHCLELWQNRRNHGRLEYPFERFHFDDQYLQKLRGRDSETLKHFVQYFSPLLCIKLRSRFQCREDIEDISQDVFSRVLKAVDQNAIQDGRKFAAYIIGVCNRTSLEAIKKIKKHRSPAVEVANTPYPETSIEDKLISEERSRRIRRILQEEMSERDRNLLIRLVAQDTDRQALAKESGYSREQLRVLLHRALRRFGAKYRASEAAE